MTRHIFTRKTSEILKKTSDLLRVTEKKILHTFMASVKFKKNSNAVTVSKGTALLLFTFITFDIYQLYFLLSQGSKYHSTMEHPKYRLG